MTEAKETLPVLDTESAQEPMSPVAPAAPRVRSGFPSSNLSTSQLLQYNDILQHLQQKERERSDTTPASSSSSSASLIQTSMISSMNMQSLSNLSRDLQTFLEVLLHYFCVTV